MSKLNTNTRESVEQRDALNPDISATTEITTNVTSNVETVDTNVANATNLTSASNETDTKPILSYPFNQQKQQQQQQNPYHQHQQQLQPSSSSIPHAGTRPPQLNSDIQARIMAFQQKRTQHVNSPPLSASSSPSASNLTLDLSDIRRRNSPIPNGATSSKPLPPLPRGLSETVAKVKHAAPVKRALSDSVTQDIPLDFLPTLSQPEQQEEITPAISRLPTPHTPISAYNSQFEFKSPPAKDSPPSPHTNQQAFELTKKKPSLSQRRGMKLNMNDLNRDPVVDSTFETNSNPSSSALTSTNNTPTSGKTSRQSPIFAKAELSRKPSDRKNKPNFKLNMDSIANDLPDVKSTTESGDGKEPQLQGLFANYSKYVDIKEGLLNFAGKASLHSQGVDFSLGSSFRISLDQLEYVEELGRGNYGCVSKVLHKPTGVLMAMKEVRLELDETKFTQILMELEILHKCDSPFIVDFFGAFFVEGAVYMCMEYMDGGSLDRVFGNLHGVTDEACLAYIADSVISGLRELKDRHNIIHRDVKPTNILINTQGKVKLCDFGVSGNLVASLAKTNIGCQSYMAPERIRSLSPDDATYSVQSDIWSLGLTILEVAAGSYPYPAETYGNIFSQLSAIVDGEPPKLDPTIYSKEAQIFVRLCLNKNPDLRPSYAALLKNPWLNKYRGLETEMSALVSARVKEFEDEKAEKGKTSLSRSNSTQSSKFTSTAMSTQLLSVHTNQTRLRDVSTVVPELPTKVDNVHSLLRSKVKPPALHRGGLNNNRSFLSKQAQDIRDRS